MGNLRIYAKQTQLVNINNQPVYYTGRNAAQLTVNIGTLPASRQWQQYGNFIDITDDVNNIDSLSLTWTEDRDSEGVSSSTGVSFIKKSASGSLYAEGNTYLLIKQWLVDDESSTLNKVDVKIHDVGCDVWYEGYQISNEDLVYCENEICNFDLVIRQADENYQCIKRTLVSDNWQGWFPEDGISTGKKHPRFAYCNEIRPNGQLVATWKLGTFNFILTNSFLIPLVILVINPIIFAINGVIAIINAIDAILGTGKRDYIKFMDPKDILATQEETFIESAGCGREHPAPLIRDYIKNVCDKCGITVNAASAPIFFDPVRAVPFNSSGIDFGGNPHYNACYFNAPVSRGIRRSEQPSPFVAPDMNNTNYWIESNRPIKTLSTFLDDLKGLYNAEWRITNNTLYFQRKDYFQTTNPVFNFSNNAADRATILQGICFEWNGQKYPVFTQGLYANDPSDKCGNEALEYMNDFVSHGDKAVNPNLDGVNDITQQFGGTRFRLDGRSPDYICDAAQQNQNSSFLTGGFFGIIKNVMERLTNYELLLNEETATLPKILIWDGVSHDAAQCERIYSPEAGIVSTGMPPINSQYNLSARQWQFKHPYNNFVKGSRFNILTSYPPGYYTVRTFLGGLTYQQPVLLVNYPMFMDCEFAGTMWDLFHFIDDPARFASAKQIWSAKIELCCDNIKRLGLDSIGQNITLGQKVSLPRQYNPDGKIKEITLNYDPENEFGAHIELKGE